MQNAREEVGQVRVQENERIADALMPSIFAGHLMYSSVADPRQVVDEFKDRVARQSVVRRHDGQGKGG
jgi:hypothetical protein